MRLIQAEAILQGAAGGDHNDAMTLVNQVPTRNLSNFDLDDNGTLDDPLSPWVAASEAEAWTFLKRERGIELWLEGRRMADLRRWTELGTPGSVDDPGWEIRHIRAIRRSSWSIPGARFVGTSRATSVTPTRTFRRPEADRASRH